MVEVVGDERRENDIRGVKHDDPAEFNGRCHHVQWWEEVRFVWGVSRAPRGGLTCAHWLLWGSVERTPLDKQWTLILGQSLHMPVRLSFLGWLLSC